MLGNSQFLAYVFIKPSAFIMLPQFNRLSYLLAILHSLFVYCFYEDH